VVGVREAVEGASPLGGLAEGTGQGQCLLVGSQGITRVGGGMVDAAESEVGFGLPGAAVDLAGEGQDLPETGGGQAGPAPRAVPGAEAGQRGELAVTVAGDPSHLQRPGVAVDSLAVPAPHVVEAAEAVECVELSGTVAGGPGHLQRLGVAVGGRPVPAPRVV